MPRILLSKPPCEKHFTMEGTVDTPSLRQHIECTVLQAFLNLPLGNDRHDIHAYYND